MVFLVSLMVLAYSYVLPLLESILFYIFLVKNVTTIFVKYLSQRFLFFRADIDVFFLIWIFFDYCSGNIAKKAT